MNEWTCQNCGEANGGDMRFCVECGKENFGAKVASGVEDNFGADSEEPAPTVFVQPSAPVFAGDFGAAENFGRSKNSAGSRHAGAQNSSPDEKKSRFLWLLLGGGALFVMFLLIAGVGVAFFLYGGNSAAPVFADNRESDSAPNGSNDLPGLPAGVDDRERLRLVTQNLLDACLAGMDAKAKIYVKNDEADAAELCLEVRRNLPGGYRIWSTEVETIGGHTVGVSMISGKNAAKAEVSMFFTKPGGEFLFYKLSETVEFTDDENEIPSGNMNTGGVPKQNPGQFGEFKECFEREGLNFKNVDPAAPGGLTVNNRSSVSISVYRLGADDYESKYSDIPPGGSQIYNSAFKGEWWMITDIAGNCRMLVSPPNTVNVE